MNYALVNRLAEYRKRAADCKNPNFTGRSWKEFRYGAGSGLPFGTETAGRGEKGERYTDTAEQYGDLVWNSEKDGHDNQGWYADSFYDNIIRFGVVRVNTAKGRLYVPVTWADDWDGATYYFRDAEMVSKRYTAKDGDSSSQWDREYDHEEAIKTVARYADRHAEREAESAREDDAKFQAEQQTERLTEEIETDRAALKELLAERRAFRSQKNAAPNVCSAVTEKARRLIQDIRDARERIAKLANNFWEAVSE